jgi:hypothetical protein
MATNYLLTPLEHRAQARRPGIGGVETAVPLSCMSWRLRCRKSWPKMKLRSCCPQHQASNQAMPCTKSFSVLWAGGARAAADRFKSFGAMKRIAAPWANGRDDVAAVSSA